MVAGNVAAGKIATAEVTDGRGIAPRAVDGLRHRTSDMNFGSCYLPNTESEASKILRIDLGESMQSMISKLCSHQVHYHYFVLFSLHTRVYVIVLLIN